MHKIILRNIYFLKIHDSVVKISNFMCNKKKNKGLEELEGEGWLKGLHSTL